MRSSGESQIIDHNFTSDLGSKCTSTDRRTLPSRREDQRRVEKRISGFASAGEVWLGVRKTDLSNRAIRIQQFFKSLTNFISAWCEFKRKPNRTEEFLCCQQDEFNVYLGP